MPEINFPIALIPSSSMTASITSEPFSVLTSAFCAVQAVYTGSPVGSLKLQASNSGLNSATWVDIPGATDAVTAAGSTIFNLAPIGYGYLRLVYTFTSGSGTLEVLGVGKGG